jgi:hypothetical protein
MQGAVISWGSIGSGNSADSGARAEPLTLSKHVVQIDH